MGGKDLYQSDFYENNDRFADVFNGVFFAGSQIMKREEKFTPVITLVLYLGRDRAWDGARSLHELLKMEEELKPFVTDYKLNLYDYHEHEDFSVFKTENRVLFELLSCLDDEKKVEKAMKQHQEWYDELDEESAKAILGIAGVKTNLKRLKKENTREARTCIVCVKHLRIIWRLAGKREGKKAGKRAEKKIWRT